MKTRRRARTYRRLVAASIALTSFALWASALAQAPDSTAPAAGAAAAGAPPAAPAAEPAKSDLTARVNALKANLLKDRATLAHYEWVETTTILKGGEEKSKKQERCYRGPDGKMVREPIGEQPEAKKKGGLRGKVVENKKEDIAEYVAASKKAIQQYIPPSPGRISVAKEEGRISVDVLEPGKRVRLNIKGYMVPGDLYALEVDPSANKLVGLQLTTMTEGGKEPITLQAAMGALEDGTGYPKKTTLDMKEKGITVVVENSDYKMKPSK